MKKLHSLVLLMFLLAGAVNSQEYKEILRDIFYEAEFFLVEEDYVDALGEYQKLYTRGYSESANINYRIGVCYLNIPGEKDKSIPYLEKAVKNVTERYREGIWKETQAPIDAWLYLGNAFRITEQLDRAIECYDAYRELLDDEESEMDTYAAQQILACNNAKAAMEDPVFNIRTHTGEVINTNRSDFNPVLSADENVMVYMSSLAFYDALKMSRKVEGEWTEPVNITPEVESDGDQYASFLTQDGTGLYLTREDEFDSDIYYSSYEEGRWSASKPLGKLINTKYWESHACVDPTGEYLYFASNRRFSRGGTDIYVSRKTDLGFWGDPKNLGETINTELNEDHPFISEDGTKLYFTSQGHYNIGGYDVFYSLIRPDGTWSEPIHLGYPINTTDDDLFFFPSDNGNSGYQALFADGNMGARDIYKYQLFGTFGDYQAALNPPEEIPEEEPALEEDEQAVGKVAEGTEGVAEAVEQARIYVIKPVFFDFDKSELKPDARSALDDLAMVLGVFPRLELEAVGHTDSKGPESYNIGLAERRSLSVIRYLVSQGVEENRMLPVSKGESSPVAINTNADGSDSPEGRQLNRRVEFRLVRPEFPNVRIEAVPVPERLRK